jgi:hypothetical protein
VLPPDSAAKPDTLPDGSEERGGLPAEQVRKFGDAGAVRLESSDDHKDAVAVVSGLS